MLLKEATDTNLKDLMEGKASLPEYDEIDFVKDWPTGDVGKLQGSYSLEFRR